MPVKIAVAILAVVALAGLLGYSALISGGDVMERTLPISEDEDTLNKLELFFRDTQSDELIEPGDSGHSYTAPAPSAPAADYEEAGTPQAPLQHTEPVYQQTSAPPPTPTHTSEPTYVTPAPVVGSDDIFDIEKELNSLYGELFEADFVEESDI